MSLVMNSLKQTKVLGRIGRRFLHPTKGAVDPAFDKVVISKFPGAIPNTTLVPTTVGIVEEKGLTPDNTLLATSLCCDELARTLEHDFLGVYGQNFSLGGLSGFPFAGNTGFGAMAAHIPDDGFCLLIYGPHVGIAQDGTVGKVERQGIALIDTCCGSAVAANNYLHSLVKGSAPTISDIQKFSDFQQGAVQQLILPHALRLTEAEDVMVELPFALFDSQNQLMSDIVKAGAAGTKKGLALMGGIQINTSPVVPDYFLPLRFDFINTSGDVVEDLLPKLTA